MIIDKAPKVISALDICGPFDHIWISSCPTLWTNIQQPWIHRRFDEHLKHRGTNKHHGAKLLEASSWDDRTWQFSWSIFGDDTWAQPILTDPCHPWRSRQTRKRSTRCWSHITNHCLCDITYTCHPQVTSADKFRCYRRGQLHRPSMGSGPFRETDWLWITINEPLPTALPGNF